MTAEDREQTAMETFRISLTDLLAANHPGFVRHVERAYAGLITLYASMPASTAPPVKVRRNLRIADGWRRLAAAKLRGDVDVLCRAATLQEELSA
jgi:hypothetical protein